MVIHEDLPGKGLAVKIGMLAAHGQFRFFCDVDFSMPITEIPKFLPRQLTGVDIAIASREAKGAIRYGEPKYRHLIGRAFNLMVSFLVLPIFKDTQCGFKCFSADAAETLFPMQTISGWTFDVEILALANKMGHRIVEVPIRWHYQPQSKVNIVRDFSRTFRELLIFRSRLKNRQLLQKLSDRESLKD